MGCVCSTDTGNHTTNNAGKDKRTSAIDQVKNVTHTAFQGKKKDDEKEGDGQHHLKNVFTAPIEADPNYKAPSFEHSSAERDFIRDALKHNFVFAGLGKTELDTIVAAHEPHSVEKGKVIIKEGDKADYFYIVNEGEVKYTREDSVLGKGKKGASFGELALLYSAPRAATVTAVTSCRLFRLDQMTFRSILKAHRLSDDSDKLQIITNVPILKELTPEDLYKLSTSMKPRSFKKGQYLAKKGDPASDVYVVKEGQLRVTGASVGGTKYEDMTVGPGEAFGVLALSKNQPQLADCMAVVDTDTLTIDGETFNSVMGKLNDAVLRAADKRKLGAIKVLKDTYLEPYQLATLATYVDEKTFAKGENICTEGEDTEAALYLVRSGQVEVKPSSGEVHMVGEHGFFGEDQLLTDYKTQSFGSTTIKADFTATVIEDLTVGVLPLSSCSLVFDTRKAGHGTKLTESITGTNVRKEDLQKHAILGAGTFGQVWLVSSEGSSDDKRNAYALKIQSKYDLIDTHQAKGVVNERNIMAELSHPFLIKLVSSFQDDQRVYMLMGLVQGGELYSVLHSPQHDGISEKDAKFYAAGIIEGLTFMHNRGVIHRDMKPENVLIDSHGYPVIIDMGFAKHVKEKTYTFCGTPLYLAPEVIMNKGYDKCADHWSFAIMLYEFISGEYAFYKPDYDQTTIFRHIVYENIHFPARIKKSSKEFNDLLSALMVKDPSRRLGSLADGSKGILFHPWFKDINFIKLRRREIKAPWTPQIDDPLDSSHFADWSKMQDKDEIKDPPLSPEEQAIFETF